MKNIEIGIIGNGNHFNKNILPVLKNLKLFKKKNILTNANKSSFFKKNFDLIYISNQSGYHDLSIRNCLNNNFNIICEKPISINYNHLKNNVKIAMDKNLLLFDCLMYKYHEVYKFLKKKLKYKKLIFVYSSFKFPSLNQKNFRYNKKHGGFFWDSAIYPLSLDRDLLFDNKKYEINSTGIFKNKSLIKGNIIIKGKNLIKIYKWGEGQSYENSIEIICKNETYFINKFYSKFNDEVISLKIFKKNKTIFKKFSGNHFKNMFIHIIKKFRSKKFKIETCNNLINDYKYYNGVLNKTKA